MSDCRLKKIYMAAGRLFNVKRYANTKVAEIAAEAGIATGTIYNLFTGKKAILTFVVRASLEKGYLDGDIKTPIEETDTEIIVNLLKKADDKISRIFSISDENGDVKKDFVTLLSELFDMNADFLLASNNIDYNGDILKGGIFETLRTVKSNYFTNLGRTLKLYMETGEVRKLEYPKLHEKNITDILTWWAMNAYIAMPDIVIPRETAKHTAVDLLSRAYLK